ncbi:MAG: aquaporin [Methylacidiphilales bacterium]|nr:aquaporin [Candidatus Methylacidiphilales bacterium]
MKPDPLQHSHAPEYVAEFLGTACMVFFGLSAVVFDFGEGMPMSRWVPDSSLRLLITGLLFAGTGSLVAISPLGRLSGAHINPSVSLAFWLNGKMHFHDFIGYVVAQMLGGMAGAAMLAGVWKKHAASVHNGMTLPGAGWALWQVFSAEVLLTALLVLLIFIFVSSRRLMRWTPLMTWIVVAMMVWLEAPVSGTSLNTARSFGPALVSGSWHNQWIYAIAPPLGGIVGLALFRLVTKEGREVLTGKLFQAPNYRSVFKCPPQPATETKS